MATKIYCSCIPEGVHHETNDPPSLTHMDQHWQPGMPEASVAFKVLHSVAAALNALIAAMRQAFQRIPAHTDVCQAAESGHTLQQARRTFMHQGYYSLLIRVIPSRSSWQKMSISIWPDPVWGGGK